MFKLDSDTLIVTGISLLIAGAVAGLMYAAWRVYQEAPTTERDYMDPLPMQVRMAWPLISLLSLWLERLQDVDTVERIRVRLLRSGLFYLYTPYEFVSLQVVTG